MNIKKLPMFIYVFLLCFNISVLAAPKKPVLKIGFIDIDYYNYYDNNKQWRGYDIELLLKAEQYGDMDLELYPYKSYNSAINDLNSSVIDAFIHIRKTEDRQQRFLFSDRFISFDKLEIYSKKESKLDFDNLKQFDGLKVGEVSGSMAGAFFLESCKEKGVNTKVVSFDTYVALKNALDNNEIDAAVSERGTPDGYKSVYFFNIVNGYIMFSPGNSNAKDIMDGAFEQMFTAEPLCLETLSEKYSYLTENDSVQLNNEEIRYLKTNNNFNVGLFKEYKPFVYSENGIITGIIPNYYEIMGKKLGVKFTFKTYDTINELSKDLKNGVIDINAMYYGDDIIAKADNVVTTHNYISNEYNLITKGKSLDKINNVAVNTFNYNIVETQLKKSEYDFSITEYQDIDACMKALKSDQVDGIICSSNVGMWLIEKYAGDNLRFMPLRGIYFELCGALASTGQLYKIMNKCIDESEYNFQKISSEYTVADKTTITGFIESIPGNIFTVIVIIITIFIFIQFVILYKFYKKDKEHLALLQKEKENRRNEAQILADKEMNEQRYKFYSNISHDMRTPLNAVLGFAELARKTNDMGRIKDYLGKIRISGNILLNLINDTLTMSRMYKGKFKLEENAVSVTDVFTSISVPIRAIAQSKNLTFNEVYPSDSPVIVCDKLRTQKIFLNLLTNAIKYTDEGGKIDFIVEEMPSPENKLKIKASVIDNGRGIDEEFQPQLFDAFSQENNDARDIMGVGLGLSIVKELVDLMGGSITVESKKGYGSTFTVILEFEKEKDLQGFSSEEGSQKLELTDKKILLCEDNAFNAEIAQMLLQSYGAVVTIAGNGKEGVEIFKKSNIGEYYCILMDVRMPVMDGLTATVNIRSLDREDAQGVPIIAMSADTFDEDIKKCYDAGMDSYISKPLNISDFESKLSRLS